MTTDATVAAAVDRLLVPAAGADAWAVQAKALEELVIDLAGVTGRFALVLDWNGTDAIPAAVELEWSGPHRADHRLERGDLAAARAAPFCVLRLDWECLGPDGSPVPSHWPDLELPSAAARLLQTVATSHPRKGHPTELKSIVDATATASGQAGEAGLHVLGHHVASGQRFPADLPDGAALTVQAGLRSIGAVSLLTLMAEALKAAGGK